MKLPDGVVGLRKVKTVLGGEDGRTYNAGIEVGSPPYEAIRAFAGGLKAPRTAGAPMEHSVMFLPVAAPDTSEAPAPCPRPARRRKPAKKPRAQPAAKRAVKRIGKPAAKTRSAKRATRARRPGSRARR